MVLQPHMPGCNAIDSDLEGVDGGAHGPEGLSSQWAGEGA